MVEVWAVALSRDELFATTGAHRVPSAAVRDLYKVLNNAQMRVRGMLEEIDHPQQGRITVPGGPLRYQGTPQTRATPSPGIGQDDVEGYCELPGKRFGAKVRCEVWHCRMDAEIRWRQTGT